MLVDEFLKEIVTISSNDNDNDNDNDNENIIFNNEKVVTGSSVFSEKNICVLNILDFSELKKTVVIIINIMRIIYDKKHFTSTNSHNELIKIIEKLYKNCSLNEDVLAQINWFNQMVGIADISNTTNEDLVNWHKSITQILTLRGTIKNLESDKLAGIFANYCFSESTDPFINSQIITTHPVRFDERVSSNSNLFYRVAYSKHNYGVSGFSVPLEKSLTASCGAGFLPLRFLLSLEMKYLGKNTSVLEMIMQDNNDIIKVFNDIGVGKNWIDNKFKAIKENVNTLNHAIGKQVYFPVFNKEDDYLLLSPVISCGMQRSIDKRISDVKSDEKLKDIIYLNTTKNKVGGAQPQNISQQNSLKSGVNNMFKFSMPPTDKKTILEYNLLKNKGLILKPKISKEHKIFNVETIHFKARHTFMNIIFSICEKMLFPIFEYRDNYESFSKNGLFPVNEIELKLIKKIHLNHKENDILCKEITESISASILSVFDNVTYQVKEKIGKYVGIYLESL